MRVLPQRRRVLRRSGRCRRSNPLVLVLLAYLLASCCSEDTAMKRTPIQYELLQRHTSILGKLGYPLGTCLTIRGQWKHRAGPIKSQSVCFSVSQINGAPIRTKIEFEQSDLSPSITEDLADAKVGSAWTLTGYETGGYEGMPVEVMRFLEQDVQIGRPYGFYTSFVYVRCQQTDPE
jgi:hypothetical protein